MLAQRLNHTHGRCSLRGFVCRAGGPRALTSGQVATLGVLMKEMLDGRRDYLLFTATCKPYDVIYAGGAGALTSGQVATLDVLVKEMLGRSDRPFAIADVMQRCAEKRLALSGAAVTQVGSLKALLWDNMGPSFLAYFPLMPVAEIQHIHALCAVS